MSSLNAWNFGACDVEGYELTPHFQGRNCPYPFLDTVDNDGWLTLSLKAARLTLNVVEPNERIPRLIFTCHLTSV